MPNSRLAIALLAGLFFVTGANATDTCNGDDGPGVCDITATVVQVVPAPGAGPGSVALSTSTQTNYVKYSVVLKHYDLRREGFSQVRFIADTAVAATDAGPAKFFGASTPVVTDSGGAPTDAACVISGANSTHIECTINFNASSPFDYPGTGSIVGLPQPAVTFDVTVQSPTGASAGTLNMNSETRYAEAGGQPEPEFFSLTTTTNLTVPDPKVVETYLPAAGTVTTGTTGGAATCDQPFVTIVKVPAAAPVSVDLNTQAGAPAGTNFFSKIGIPDPAGAPQYFGIGTHWYDPDALNKLVVNTLRRDKCTIGSGTGNLKDAALILKEKIYYKPEQPTARAPEVPPIYKQVLLCLVTSGPYPGEPCIVFAQVYTKFNLPNVPNADALFRGDHEWVILSNENGRYAQ